MTGRDPIRALSRRLGRRQREVMLRLTADWGPSGNYQAAKRLWYWPERLLEHKHLTDDCWQLTPFGLDVQAYLRGQGQ